MLQRPASGDEVYDAVAAATVSRVTAEAAEAARAVAKAPVQVGRASAADVERAIEAAWQFCGNEDFDVPFSTAVELAQARCPQVTALQVRAGFEKRFARRLRRG
jgi:hypothetical protein